MTGEWFKDVQEDEPADISSHELVESLSEANTLNIHHPTLDQSKSVNSSIPADEGALDEINHS